jgi:hypothetical protein
VVCQPSHGLNPVRRTISFQADNRTLLRPTDNPARHAEQQATNFSLNARLLFASDAKAFLSWISEVP